MDPWRYSTQGISVALRVTPRGGRDEIDGLETLANGRTVVKIRVRAIAEGGAANRAVLELLAKALGVPKARVRVLSGRYLADHSDPDHYPYPEAHRIQLVALLRLASMDPFIDPWRYSTAGISVALRVTPRGGRDEIDGLETLADGRTVVKMRVRAIAEGGAANRAVVELLATTLGVPRAKVRVLSAPRPASSRLPSTAIRQDWAMRCET